MGKTKKKCCKKYKKKGKCCKSCPLKHKVAAMQGFAPPAFEPVPVRLQPVW